MSIYIEKYTSNEIIQGPTMSTIPFDPLLVAVSEGQVRIESNPAFNPAVVHGLGHHKRRFRKIIHLLVAKSKRI